MKADLPVEAKAFLDALAVGESGGDADPYHILYGGGHFTSTDNQFPSWAGKDNSHAAGRYQFEPATWDAVAKAMTLPDFSPDNQDAAAWWLAQDDYNRRTQRLLRGDLMAGALTHVASALQKTWTSLSPSTLGDRYNAALAKYSEPVGVPILVPTPVMAQPAVVEARPTAAEDSRLTGAKIALKMIADGKADPVMIAKLALTMMGNT